MRQIAGLSRNPRGNMLVIVGAVLAGIVILLMVFGYNYVHLLGGHQGQETAIESAALAAAQDLSRIVVDTKEFGYVSLSDDAPIGTSTAPKNGDLYYLPVRSVNTLIATARLDYIIGDNLNKDSAGSGDVISNMATHDLSTIYNSTIPQLTKVLQNAIASGGSGNDINGNKVEPYVDAENAFQQNLQRSGSGTSSVIPGTMKLAMGYLTADNGIATSVPIPNPANKASVSGTQQSNGNYMSETNVTYAGYNDSTYGGSPPFVFGSVGSAIRLVSNTNYTDSPSSSLTLNGVNLQMPSIIKVEADQKITDSQDKSMTVHSIAYAAPASAYDPRPAPGALSVSFPDGMGTDITMLKQVVSNTNLNTITVNTTTIAPPNPTAGFSNLETPTNDDYPGNATPPATILGPMARPLSSSTQPTMSDVWRLAVYDWLRHAGAKANIQSVVDAQGWAFTKPAGYKPTKDWWSLTTNVQTPPGQDITKAAPGGPIPSGFMNIFKFNPDGTVTQTAAKCYPVPYQCLSEKQMYAEAVNANPSTLSVIHFPNPPQPENLLFSNTTTTTDVSVPLVKVQTLVTTGVALTFQNMFDVYVRDQVRQPGDLLGGKHGGEPLDDSTVSMLKRRKLFNPYGLEGVYDGPDGGGEGVGAHPGGVGNGALPLLTVQSDFAELSSGDSVPAGTGTMYDNFLTGSGIRPTYTTNGSCVDIRFRRQVDIDEYKTTSVSTTTTDPLTGKSTTVTAPLAVSQTTEHGYTFFEFDN